MKTWLAVLAMGVVGTAQAERLELVSQAAAKSNAGDHAAAIALYTKAYVEEQDPQLLPILASEYRKAGMPEDALGSFCQYLAEQPKGPQAPYAATQVIAIRRERGQRVSNTDVCAVPQPVRIDTVTPRKAKPNMSKRELAGIASAAAGVAGLFAGVYYGVEARSISSDITNHAPGEAWPADIQDLEERGQRAERLQNTFLLLGSAALVTGGILYFTGRSDRMSSEQSVVTPTVSPGGVGISFARGF
jgi:hypothetical protein